MMEPTKPEPSWHDVMAILSDKLERGTPDERAKARRALFRVGDYLERTETQPPAHGGGHSTPSRPTVRTTTVERDANGLITKTVQTETPVAN